MISFILLSFGFSLCSFMLGCVFAGRHTVSKFLYDSSCQRRDELYKENQALRKAVTEVEEKYQELIIWVTRSREYLEGVHISKSAKPFQQRILRDLEL